MNDKLKNDNKKTDREQRRKAWQNKYMSRHKTLCVTLDNTEDADILEWLGSQDNRSESVRTVLRREAWKVGTLTKNML